MSFDKLLTDKISITRTNGEFFDSISASVQGDKIFLSRSDILIEVGDFIERKMSNGGIEQYIVRDPGFHEKFGGIPAGYQMSVRRASKSEKPNKPGKPVAGSSSTGNSDEPQKLNSKIFIVHGHDEVAKLTVARFIEQVGLHPIILHEQASSSRTIIEKIEGEGDVGFAIVLYTPCDSGSKIGSEHKLRARQNVVFEHGYFIGRLGRSKVAALVKGSLETPNDISGVVYIDLDERGGWKIDIAKELRAAGYDVDMSKAF
ncbi:nucleotide-binding protein [Pseudomonas plecoglossicida]|uniref:nucleotide-binding protein n=1 Tax=Pseudomonas putida group TaxID=136845 RepID=UPI00240FCF8A|nr:MULTISPECIES: nucleotide-binding protein [Pseudomonas putida group]MDQ7967738.1 nucleotide-binding protein [Pseudomonas plecoglossicida]WFG05290.1 nucleotide-binding protein [Pseudomonas putida]